MQDGIAQNEIKGIRLKTKRCGVLLRELQSISNVQLNSSSMQGVQAFQRVIEP